ncbi:hypothetical protein VY732_27565 [Pseudomonas sp. ZY71]|uniref:hypothetical protein n=1 Tax=Pseudomonas sp. ZY71 TaxID=3115647 RepID=UPI002F40C071
MPTYTEILPATSFPPPPSTNSPTLAMPTIYSPAVTSGARLIKIPPILQAIGTAIPNPNYYALGCYLFNSTRINDTLDFLLVNKTTLSTSVVHTRKLDKPLLQACIDSYGGIYWFELWISNLAATPGKYELNFIHSNAAGKVVGVSSPRAYQVT